MKMAGFVLLGAIETVLIALLWVVAISGFWNGPGIWTRIATGTAACAIALAVSFLVVVAIMREVRKP